MIAFLISFYFVLSFFAILFPYEKRHKLFFLFFIGLVLIVNAGIRPPGIDLDYYNYYNVFTYGSSSLSRFEPAFFFIVSIAKFFSSDVVGLFLLYALIAIFIKFYAIKKLTKLWYLSLIVYFCHYYILHEMTQIRAGLASGILLFSTQYLVDRNFKKYFIGVFFATMFHYSSIIFLPLWLLQSKGLNKKFYISIILISLILGLYGFRFSYLISYIPIPEINLLFELYSRDVEHGIVGDLNILSGTQIIKTLISILLIINVDKLSFQNKYVFILLKTYIIGIITFIFFQIYRDLVLG